MDSSTQDIHAPKIEQAKRNLQKHEESKLDEALEDTFPASDPPAMTAPHNHAGSGEKPAHPEDSQTKNTESPAEDK